MTDAEINLAVAAVAGWHDFVFRGLLAPSARDYIGRHPSLQEGFTSAIPDYITDLNAVAQVEARLTAEQWDRYVVELSRECGASVFSQSPFIFGKALLAASARQRCIALLKVHGKL